jgi:hypothetical protein
MAGSAAADTTQTSNFISVGINENGSFDSLKHAPAGDGNFGVNDYITPGTPHESWGYTSTQSGFRENGNATGTDVTGSLTATGAAGPYAYGATYTGSDDYISITHVYGFNTGDERISVTTTITALQDLTGLVFARSVDPDPDVNTSGSFVTNNQRGNMLFGVTDFVGAAGPVTGLTLGLLNLGGNAFTHNTQINSFCCNMPNPDNIISGLGNEGDVSVGDHSISMAWLIGSLSTGSSATLNYAYVVGDNIGTVGGGAVPEPATWAMMIMGFGAMGSVLRRRRSAVAAA